MITKKRTYVQSRYRFLDGLMFSTVEMVSTIEMVCPECANTIPDTNLVTMTVTTNADEYGLNPQDVCSVCGKPIADEEE